VDRRDFLKSTAAIFPGGAVASLAAPPAFAQQPTPWADGTRWRSFEIVTRVDVLKPDGTTRVWIPVPLSTPTDYFTSLGNGWSGNADAMRLVRGPREGDAMFYAEWGKPVEAPFVELTSRFAARDRAVAGAPAGTAPRPAAPSRDELQYYLKPTEFIPTDGIVRDTALKATRGAKSDLDRSRAIYEWIVDNTHRDPKVRGCGWGDIKTMLETGNLGGKCGDLNALFVGLSRAVGIPARDVYGLRVVPSQWGYRSMSAAGNVTGAQHCRAEFYLPERGWVPVDPADVRKVVLEEPPGNLAVADPKVKLARASLFGAWEMNWCAFNYSHDVKLPGSESAPLPYLMYPTAETRTGRKDSLDPANFRYAINAREITV
jgi:transglutaminase-like putative cysteine protease